MDEGVGVGVGFDDEGKCDGSVVVDDEGSLDGVGVGCVRRV